MTTPFRTQTLARSLGAGGVNGGLSPLYLVGGPRPFHLTLGLSFQHARPAARLRGEPCVYPKSG